MYRIPEKNLFMWALLGGSIGILLGIRFFHHKSKHLRFTIGIPLILLAQFIIILISIVVYSHIQKGFP